MAKPKAEAEKVSVYVGGSTSARVEKPAFEDQRDEAEGRKREWQQAMRDTGGDNVYMGGSVTIRKRRDSY